MPPIECFLLRPTDFVRRDLRRFTFCDKKACRVVSAANPYSGHEARVVIEPRLYKPRAPDGVERSPEPSAFAGDPRWPERCRYCAYYFVMHDERQVNDHRLYENAERGVLTTLRWDETPAGAMWWADWMQNFGSRHWEARGGGPHLMVQTPGGTWDLDYPSTNGDGWEWSGEPPKVTARPSIGIGKTPEGAWKYHGWLTDGLLTEA